MTRTGRICTAATPTRTSSSISFPDQPSSRSDIFFFRLLDFVSRFLPRVLFVFAATRGGAVIPAKRAVGICLAMGGDEPLMKHDGDELRKVLVVDDDDDLAEVVRQLLRDAGYSVAAVRQGAAALEHVKHIAPELILLDLSMPIMDGWSFVAQYRRIAKHEARIVLLTGNASAPEIAQTLGADGYITKPFDMEDLIAIVRRELAISRSAGDISSSDTRS